MGRTGAEVIAGYKSVSSGWGNVGVVGANLGLIPKDLPVLAINGEIVYDEGLASFNELQYGDLVRENVEGSIPFTMRRTGAMWKLWAHLFGDDTVTGANPYTHTFNWQQESALYGTLAWEVNNADIWEIPAVKPSGAVIQPDGSGLTELTFNFMGDTVNTSITDSLDNNGDAFNAVTYTTKTLVMPSEECRIRLNSQSGGALGSGDVLSCTNYSLSIARQLTGDRITAGVSTGAERRIQEPKRSGFTEITLSLEFEDYTTATRFLEHKSENLYKADLYWAKTISTAFSFLIELGSLKPEAPAGNIAGGNRIPLTWNFRALQPQSTPTGMATSKIIHSVLVDAFSSTYE